MLFNKANFAKKCVQYSTKESPSSLGLLNTIRLFFLLSFPTHLINNVQS